MHADTLSEADQRPDGLARVEDRRLLTGRGQYVHDLQVPGMLYAVFVRSTYACARLRGLDLQAARAGADVLAVIDAAQLGALTMPPANPLLPLQPLPDFPLLARKRVDFLGQPIALVVARSLYAAQHAAELVEVDYDAEPALGDGAAGAQTVSRVHHQAGDLSLIHI